ncbi:MAG: SDR family NAD(P)-dependent oxidoreductase [Candidatus Dormibacteria bacterium]
MRETVVVAGAGGALGRAVVAALLLDSRRVVAIGRTGYETGADRELWAGRSVDLLGSDLTDPASVAGVWARVDRIGEVSALVNVVGGFQAGTVGTTPTQVYRQSFATNLDSVWWSCHEAVSRLSRRQDGAIVNVASRAALKGGVGSAAYAVSKAAVVRLTEVLAAELAPHRVRVNAVLPAVMDTPPNRAAGGAAPPGAVPPEAIAKVIAFLVSADGWPISGAAIPVYGWA